MSGSGLASKDLLYPMGLRKIETKGSRFLQKDSGLRMGCWSWIKTEWPLGILPAGSWDSITTYYWGYHPTFQWGNPYKAIDGDYKK